VPIRKITDGTSKSIAMGEGAYGDTWQVSGATKAGQDRKAVATGLAAQRQPYMAWINAEPSFLIGPELGVYLYSVVGCTLEPLNKNPVTSAWVDAGALNSDGSKSLPGAKGTRRPTSCEDPDETDDIIEGENCGTHVAPNFRSDHPGGGHFLFGDGSAHFIQEDIDMLVYQQLSTIFGDEVVEVPE
jgi:prepilin-type processing-associated H-X9-DG protein